MADRSSITLSIIIISYNTADLTLHCLDSIVKTLAGDALFSTTEVIIVDNHSSDNSVLRLKQWKKNALLPLTILANKTNAGFASANNQGILQARGRHILLLNSDTVLKPNALQNLVAAADDPANTTYGLFAAALLYEDGTDQPQGGDLPSLVSLLSFAFLLDDLPIIGSYFPSHQHTGRRFIAPATAEPSRSSLQRKGWIAGTALLIRSEVITDIGLLDDSIFMYAEDLEYCWRAHKRGWQSAIISNSQIVHLGSRSSSSSNAITGEFTSLKYVLRKHLPGWQNALAQPLLRAAALLRWLLFSLLGKKDRAHVYRHILHSL